MFRTPAFLAGIASVATALAACGTTTSPAPSAPVATSTPAATPAIDIKNLAFNPGATTIRAGTTVTWTNNDTTTHTAVSDDGTFNSQNIEVGHAFTFVFPTAGTYRYHCAIHPAMTGTITVTA